MGGANPRNIPKNPKDGDKTVIDESLTAPRANPGKPEAPPSPPHRANTSPAGFRVPPRAATAPVALEVAATGPPLPSQSPFPPAVSIGQILAQEREGFEECMAKAFGTKTPVKNFGRYQVERELGRGGMGTVLLVYDSSLKRQVALKTLLEQGKAIATERFLREAGTLARFKHPNIIRIYDIGQEKGIHFFTMDYIEGPTLAHWLQEKPHSLSEAVPLVPRGSPAQHWRQEKSHALSEVLEIMIKVARAIHYAHEAGILHRDLKPANIMINRYGEPVVMDFGLAREMDSSTSLSQQGSFIGTPAYMPPEQALGKREEIDERSDVYGLGAILYELLTGEPPFSGANPAAIAFQVIQGKPVPPRRKQAEIPPEVEAICLKAMAKKREDRYATAEDLARDLEAYRQRRPVQAVLVNQANQRTVHLTALGWGYRARKWLARQEMGFFLCLGLSLLLAVLSLLYVAHLSQLRAATGRKREQTRQWAGEVQRLEATRVALRQRQEEVTAGLPALTQAQEKRVLLNQILWESVAQFYRETPTWQSRSDLLQPLKTMFRTLKTLGLQESLEPKAEIGENYRWLHHIAYPLQQPAPASVKPEPSSATTARELQQPASVPVKREPASQNSLQKANDYFQSGVRHYNQQMYAEAERDYTKAIELNPNCAEAYNNRGSVYYSQKRYAEAERDYTKVIEINPNCAEAYMGRGNVYYAQIGRGNVYYDQQRYAEAERDFSKSIELNPNSLAYTNRGNMYYSQKKYAEAERDYTKAIALNPNIAEAYTNRGNMYYSQKKYAEAQLDFAKASQLTQNNPR